jgi:hypothetical protein
VLLVLLSSCCYYLFFGNEPLDLSGMSVVGVARPLKVKIFHSTDSSFIEENVKGEETDTSFIEENQKGMGHLLYQSVYSLVNCFIRAF